MCFLVDGDGFMRFDLFPDVFACSLNPLYFDPVVLHTIVVVVVCSCYLLIVFAGRVFVLLMFQGSFETMTL